MLISLFIERGAIFFRCPFSYKKYSFLNKVFLLIFLDEFIEICSKRVVLKRYGYSYSRAACFLIQYTAIPA